MTSAVPSTRRMALLLAGLAMFGPFSIDTIFPAFSQLGRSLAVDQVAIQQTISVYLLAYGLMSIAHGPLSDAWGRKRVILGGLALFVAGSIGCALSQDLPTLLAFRALQGLSAGVGMIVGRAVIRDLFHGPDAQRLMSQVSMIFGIAPAIAPIIGGWILLSGGGWPLIFWFLVVFGLVLLIATLTWLPETHPVEARTPLQFKRLLQDYVRIGFNPRFQRLAAAGSFNFAGIFLYIASAPVLIMQHLKLGEGDFAWLFIPTIGGMTLGSFLSGRMAGRMQPVRQIRIGFICCGVAALANLAYTFAVAQIALPWAVLPIFLAGVGMALIFPILALAVLDMYPQQRGLASSLQAFTQLMTNTVVAGVLSPLLSEHPRHLAIGMTGFFLLGWLFWRWERRSGRRLRHRQATEAVPLEPADHL
ncbi:multidrug effflux MFS transporter [Xanthomonas euvesicatoria pv. euvesicatoria]|uniref:Bcr/CflA family efflux transporter n=5 Tax=Xanthomonas euvesicatoria TaxID=456327 RepID=Q3BW85_XANE5|nr:multidrug effflux MFS transporter [Xanthomonas euvesicatoria]AOY68803.1 Bcr/CflA family drug resistance efflux transporter [Xanthomonas euvesicatoria pv. vesicatoria str. 85-10]APO91398.1 Bcr/CflA family drug resistance efflux transporter [Xanthomonas euvesicatoria]KHL61801.1 MFS transporter [Xanthomonas euvesicatoria]KHL64066.1 MFS transporter [Xanthomonas euvesicatoria]KLA52624.1 MFS transporter [Xanthomonas euvesicatoria]